MMSFTLGWTFCSFGWACWKFGSARFGNLGLHFVIRRMSCSWKVLCIKHNNTKYFQVIIHLRVVLAFILHIFSSHPFGGYNCKPMISLLVPWYYKAHIEGWPWSYLLVAYWNLNSFWQILYEIKENDIIGRLPVPPYVKKLKWGDMHVYTSFVGANVWK